MAGRGVDIKLGGEMADEIIAIVSRVLKRAGFDPYNMRLEEQRQAIIKMNSADYGIYESEIRYFLQYFEDMETVRRVGGLHVIGSERHEARRIDNQLRGRAARQGDPGSSRFYLSLQDDLMRMFGGEQVDNIMQRFRLDDDFPLENRMVTGLIEQSQHRVEGSNFDVRKHLLEYDDVLNKQRTIIYAQRDKAMTKADLTEDIAVLLKAEIAARVPPAMADPEGPWKLLAWLEQIQPVFFYGDKKVFPSFTFRLLLDELSASQGNPRETLMDIVRRAVASEEEHILTAIEQSVAKTAESLESQLQERFDGLDTFLGELGDREGPQKASELLDEMKSVLHMDIRLNAEQLRLLTSTPLALEKPIKDQVDIALSSIAITRLMGSIEYRMNEQLPVKADELARLDWDEAAARLMQAGQQMLVTRRERLTGANGQVARELETILSHQSVSEMDETALIGLLASLGNGRRTVFNARTHKQETQEFQRFNYFYLAAQMLARRKPDSNRAGTGATVSDDILAHLEEATARLLVGWGQAEYAQVSQNAETLGDFDLAGEDIGLPADTLVGTLTAEQRGELMEALGQRRTAEIQRNVLLGVITELWVEYLTRVESLRVSIGLEAYGQRDPLVQYKTKASDMFQTLMGEVRSGVIDRVFRYLPRLVAMTDSPVEVAAPGGSAPRAGTGAIAETSSPESTSSSEQSEAAARAGRKRHKKK
jgi:preprotein translocase subunit SecA